MSIQRIASVVFLLSATAFAESNTSTIVSGVTSNAPDGVIVGYWGTNNTLLVTNAGVLNTVSFSAIGIMTNAGFNAATVTGAGSIWSSGAGFYVGGFGSFNRLTISAGGKVIVSNIAYLAMDSISSNNSMLITGSGSTFVLPGNHEFDIGFAGSDNSVTVSNGGVLAAGNTIAIGKAETAARNSLLVYGGVVTSSWVYVGDDGGFSNRVLLTGASSVLYASNTFACGVSGRASRVEVLNGARIEDGWGTIGWEIGSDSNVAVVSGSGSSWSNRNRFYVGRWGSFNTLVITNGGTVWAGDWTSIGEQSNSFGNLAIVTGPGSSWLVTNMFLVGYGGTSNRLEIRDGASVTNGWSAYIGDSPGGSSNANGNSVLVTGTNTRWFILDSLNMGADSARNRLELRGGAFLSDSNAYIGWGESIWSGNVADVSGPGTIWTNSGDVTAYGSGNRIVASNGATIYSLEMAVRAGSVGEPARIVIDGTNTRWFCAGGADAASYATLVITNGARLFSAYGMLGEGDTDASNNVVVTGPGSIWTNSGYVDVGWSGNKSLLIVERGGKVFSSSAKVGGYTGGDHNTARVTDSNSAWQCAGSLLVGDSHFNSLLVESAGAFSCTSAVVGLGMSNEVVVTGAGSSWSNSGKLVISHGTFGDYAGFTVSSGAFAYSENAVLAEGHGSSSYAIVTSPGSVWSNASSLWIGQTGKLNRLTVENGGRLFSGSAVIGVATASVGNVATVTGSGSSWSNAGSLIVGQGSSSNSLVISGGARVDAGSVVVGALGTARGSSLSIEAAALYTRTTRVDYGTMIMSNGLLYTGYALINTNGSLTGSGTVTVYATSFDNYGVVRPGSPIGRLSTRPATYEQYSSSTLEIELGGREPGISYDQLVTGTFDADGTLTVLRRPGFVPSTGDTFLVVDALNSYGNFATTNLPPWFTWSVQYLSAGVVVSVAGVDTATNGVPKAWLADCGWTNNFDAAATNDADGDHVATWEEYYAGTDPTNNKSFFQCLEISKTNFPTLGKIIRWNAVTGHVYAVEASTNLTSGWQELTNNLAAPANSWTDTVGSANRQYRLRAGPL